MTTESEQQTIEQHIEPTEQPIEDKLEKLPIEVLREILRKKQGYRKVSSSMIKDHMRTATKTYSCQLCPALFMFKKNLRKHLKQEHTPEETSTLKPQQAFILDLPEQKYIDE